ncbi:guanylate cyclase, partial [Thraustotheca clavata]
FGPSENEARTAFMRLLRHNNQSASSVVSQAPTKSILSESRFKQNTLLESTAVFYPQDATRDAPVTPDGLMQLPPDMTKRNVFFYINTTNTLENMFRKENEKRWMRFFRASILLCILVKPVQTMYSSNALLNSRQFQAANILFIINICFTMPVCTCFLLFTFTDTFLRYRQLSSVCVLILISAFWNTELIAMQSRGYAYISTLVLYQCHFSMISFVFRFMTTAIILGMYLLANIALSNSIIPGMTGNESTRDTLMLCLRNAFYVVVFFVPQIWVVFTCEFKERVNHFRDLVLSAQQVKLLDEQDRVAKLLRNLLPESIVHQLKSSPEATIAEKFENVTILFTDMVNFTAYSSRVSAMELVQFLNDMYTRFDTISERRDLYKVEIIGDAYFVVGGCPLVTNNDAVTVLQAGLDMLSTLPILRRNSSNPNLNIRIGVHSGRVVAGVVGIKDPRYHLFGETVAIAQSLESSGVPGRIHLSETTYTRVKNTDPNAFKFEYHKMLTVTGHNTKLRT